MGLDAIIDGIVRLIGPILGYIEEYLWFIIGGMFLVFVWFIINGFTLW